MALVGVYICAFGSAGLSGAGPSGRPGVASAQRGPGDAGVPDGGARLRADFGRSGLGPESAFRALSALRRLFLAAGWPPMGRSGSVGFRVVALCYWAYVGGLVGGGAGGPRWPSRGIAHSTRLTGPHTPNKFWYRSQTGLGRINGRGIPLRLLNSCRLWS